MKVTRSAGFETPGILFSSKKNQKDPLIGGDWNMTGLFSHSGGNFIIPIDELIFSRGVGIPPTNPIWGIWYDEIGMVYQSDSV